MIGGLFAEVEGVWLVIGSKLHSGEVVQVESFEASSFIVGVPADGVHHGGGACFLLHFGVKEFEGVVLLFYFLRFRTEGEVGGVLRLELLGMEEILHRVKLIELDILAL